MTGPNTGRSSARVLSGVGGGASWAAAKVDSCWILEVHGGILRIWVLS